LLKKELIDNMNKKINDISEVLEKMKKISDDKLDRHAFILEIVEKNVLDEMGEINEILTFINYALDEINDKT
jgi:hypothetical protein